MYVVKNFPESRRNYILGWTKATDLAKGEKQESSHPEWPSGLLGKKGWTPSVIDVFHNENQGGLNPAVVENAAGFPAAPISNQKNRSDDRPDSEPMKA